MKAHGVRDSGGFCGSHRVGVAPSHDASVLPTDPFICYSLVTSKYSDEAHTGVGFLSSGTNFIDKIRGRFESPHDERS